MSFKELNLNSALLNAINDLGFTQPTTIQHKVFSEVMAGKDIVGLAQTGTGKTLAYLLPLLRMWTYQKNKTPQILVLVPTRELVTQVLEEVEKLSKYMNFSATGAYGGTNIKTQMMAILNGVDLVVATPGRLIDLLLNGTIKTKGIKKLVIDEMDEIMNLGFRTQLNNILDLLPPKRQNLLFSATITDEVEQLLDVYFNNPIKIEAAPMGTPLENITQICYEVPNFNTKVNLLKYLLASDSEMNKVLIFTATKTLADEIYELLLTELPDEIGVIHSNKAQNARFLAVNRFKEGSFKILIATDLVARGIDISEVSHVINLDTPQIPENYIHRIGRTGRADKKGIAITFTSVFEMESKDEIEHLMNFTIPVKALPETVEVSDVLIADEKPRIVMPNYKNKKSSEEVGPAFHEKKAKNKKVNQNMRRSEALRAKYGKPKTKRN